ncbi:DNA-3-methyladenine glycosylase 1-like [Epargyreus clarus]|uniref:DNA-3-methyladenine glycosylase 1-like n=1 Tax=Epargyreus clarus TaxID=520877 RepID=UPI003C2C4692
MLKRKNNNIQETIASKNMKVVEDVVRCDWVTKDPLYKAYHDNEWGKPEFNSIHLFEMLCLGGQQAGLSWITVLKKREHYRTLFHNFNPYEVSKLDQNNIEHFLCDPGIIRNRRKLEAIVKNAKCYLKMEENGIDFSKFVWRFVDYAPIVNQWSNIQEVPTQTKASSALSNALKKRGFKFVGSTICYAFMQTCGLVNDHIIKCICYNKKY